MGQQESCGWGNYDEFGELTSLWAWEVHEATEGVDTPRLLLQESGSGLAAGYTAVQPTSAHLGREM